MLNSSNLELNYMVNTTDAVLDTFNKVRWSIPSSTVNENGDIIDNHEYQTSEWFGKYGIKCRVTRNSIVLDLNSDGTYSNLLNFCYVDTISYFHPTTITNGSYRMYRDNRDYPYYRITNRIDPIVEAEITKFDPDEIDALTFQYLTLYPESTTGLILYDSYLYSIMPRENPMQFRMRHPSFTYNEDLDINEMFTTIQKVLEQVEIDHFVDSEFWES